MSRKSLSFIMTEAHRLKAKLKLAIGACLRIAWAKWRARTHKQVVVRNDETGASYGYRYICEVVGDIVWTLAYAQQDANGFYSEGKASGPPAETIQRLARLTA